MEDGSRGHLAGLQVGVQAAARITQSSDDLLGPGLRAEMLLERLGVEIEAQLHDLDRRSLRHWKAEVVEDVAQARDDHMPLQRDAQVRHRRDRAGEEQRPTVATRGAHLSRRGVRCGRAGAARRSPHRGHPA